jgi:hypothetical protein
MRVRSARLRCRCAAAVPGPGEPRLRVRARPVGGSLRRSYRAPPYRPGSRAPRLRRGLRQGCDRRLRRPSARFVRRGPRRRAALDSVWPDCARCTPDLVDPLASGRLLIDLPPRVVAAAASGVESGAGCRIPGSQRAQMSPTLSMGLFAGPLDLAPLFGSW